MFVTDSARNIQCIRDMKRAKEGKETVVIMKMTTLCYIEKDGRYLMLHRTKKEKDINKGKWIGVGGHA